MAALANNTSIWSSIHDESDCCPVVTTRPKRRNYKSQMLPVLNPAISEAITNTVAMFLLQEETTGAHDSPLGRRPPCIGQEAETEPEYVAMPTGVEMSFTKPTLCCVSVSKTQSLARKIKKLGKTLKAKIH